MKRHKWNDDDACVNCGTVRSGCSAGRTGSMNYYTADGAFRTRAGSCVPPSPMLVETALRRAAARNGRGETATERSERRATAGGGS